MPGRAEEGAFGAARPGVRSAEGRPELYWLTLAISKRQRRKALSLTAYTAVKSSKTEKNFVREYKKDGMNGSGEIKL